MNERDKDRRALCVSVSLDSLTCFFILKGDHCRSSVQVDLADGRYVSARRHRKGHPKSGEKVRQTEGIRSKTKIRPYSTAETSETVRTRSEHENVAQPSDVISRETAPVRVPGLVVFTQSF